MTITQAAILSSIVSLVFLGHTLLLARIHSESRSIRLFVIAAVLITVGMILSALREVVPWEIAVIAGNTVALTGLMLLYPASRVLLNKSGSWSVAVGVTAAASTALWFSWFTLVQPDFQMRMYWVSAMWFLTSVMSAALFYTHREEGLNAILRLTGVVLTVVAAVSASWLIQVSGLTAAPRPDEVLPWSMRLPFICNLLLLLSIAVIINLIVTTRANRELSRARVDAERANRTLLELSWADSRTGVATRARIAHVLNHEMMRQEQSEQPLSAMLLAVDSMDRVTEKLGYRAGDETLSWVAGIMRRVLQVEHFPLDTVGRWGHNEFLAVLPGVTADEARHRAEWIRFHVLEREDELAQMVTCSIGVVEITAIDTEIDVLARLDMALYRARDRGPNRIEAG